MVGARKATGEGEGGASEGKPTKTRSTKRFPACLYTKQQFVWDPTRSAC